MTDPESRDTLLRQAAANRARADKIASSAVEHNSREYWRQVSECWGLRSWADGVEAGLAAAGIDNDVLAFIEALLVDAYMKSCKGLDRAEAWAKYDVARIRDGDYIVPSKATS